MIVDAHNHIGKRKGLTFLVEELIEKMDMAEIEKAVVFSMNELIDNDYVGKSVNKYDDRLIGFIYINPWSFEAESEIERCHHEYGMRGIKLHPVKYGFNFDDHFLLDPIFALCEKLNLPVLSYGAADVASVPNHFEEMANTFPNVNFIMSHMGYMYETNSAIGVASRTSNVYLETSGVFVRQIQKAKDSVGAERIIFGTDTPKEEFDFSIERVQMVTEDPDELDLILGKNILDLLNK